MREDPSRGLVAGQAASHDDDHCPVDGGGVVFG